jgi:hypothetical protein
VEINETFCDHIRKTLQGKIEKALENDEEAVGEDSAATSKFFLFLNLQI